MQPRACLDVQFRPPAQSLPVSRATCRGILVLPPVLALTHQRFRTSSSAPRPFAEISGSSLPLHGASFPENCAQSGVSLQGFTPLKTSDEFTPLVIRTSEAMRKRQIQQLGEFAISLYCPQRTSFCSNIGPPQNMRNSHTLATRTSSNTEMPALTAGKSKLCVATLPM
jgi:hypothetical protein